MSINLSRKIIYYFFHKGNTKDTRIFLSKLSKNCFARCTRNKHNIFILVKERNLKISTYIYNRWFFVKNRQLLKLIYSKSLSQPREQILSSFKINADLYLCLTYFSPFSPFYFNNKSTITTLLISISDSRRAFNHPSSLKARIRKVDLWRGGRGIVILERRVQKYNTAAGHGERIPRGPR